MISFLLTQTIVCVIIFLGDNMNINKIIKLKNNKYKILIDDEFITTYDNVILENELLYKKKLDKELYNKIKKDTEYYDIYDKVVKHILKKRRSEKEVKCYIEKYTTNKNYVENIINKLKNINLINDLEYCKSFINDRVYLSKNGINKIKNDLLNQDIPLEIIEQELKNIDINIINQRLEKIIIKKINNNKKYSFNQLKQKILNELIILGYDKKMILEVIDNNIKDDNDIIKKEYNKLYNKLKTKYEGYELCSKIKQKLLIKGFTNEEINLLINEKKEV